MHRKSMTQLQILKRAIALKKQAIPLIRSEIVDLEERFILIRMLQRLEAKTTRNFDPMISRQIDAVHVLLEDI